MFEIDEIDIIPITIINFRNFDKYCSKQFSKRALLDGDLRT